MKALWIVVFIAIILRFAFLGIDPPMWSTGDLGLFADEGYKTFSARNLILFGSEKTAIYDSYPGWHNQSPVSHYLFVFIFSILGTGYMQARLIPILAGILTLFLFYVIVKKYYPNHALWSTSMLGINFTLLIYNKIALLESIFIPFLLLAIWFFEKKIWGIPFMIICFALALLTKKLAIFFLPVLIYMIVVRMWPLLKNNFKLYGILTVIGGITLLAITYITGFLQNLIALALNRLPSIQSVFGLVRQTLLLEFYLFNVVLVVLAFLGALIIVQDIVKKRIHHIDIIFLLWSISLAGLLSIQAYRPVRYHVPLVISLVFIWMLMHKRLEKHKWSDFILVFGVSMIIGIVSYALVSLIIDASSYKNIWMLGVILISALLTFTPLAKILSWLYSKQGMILGALMYSLVSITFIVVWFANPTYALIESSQDLNNQIPHNSVILGINWAQALCLETNFVCYKVFNDPNEKNIVFKELNITHIIADNFSNPDYDVEFLQNPRFYESIEYITSYQLGRYNTSLYAFNATHFYNEN